MEIGFLACGALPRIIGGFTGDPCPVAPKRKLGAFLVEWLADCVFLVLHAKVNAKRRLRQLIVSSAAGVSADLPSHRLVRD